MNVRTALLIVVVLNWGLEEVCGGDEAPPARVLLSAQVLRESSAWPEDRSGGPVFSLRIGAGLTLGPAVLAASPKAGFKRLGARFPGLAVRHAPPHDVKPMPVRTSVRGRPAWLVRPSPGVRTPVLWAVGALDIGWRDDSPLEIVVAETGDLAPREGVSWALDAQGAVVGVAACVRDGGTYYGVVYPLSDLVKAAQSSAKPPATTPSTERDLLLGFAQSVHRKDREAHRVLRRAVGGVTVDHPWFPDSLQDLAVSAYEVLEPSQVTAMLSKLSIRQRKTSSYKFARALILLRSNGVREGLDLLLEARQDPRSAYRARLRLVQHGVEVGVDPELIRRWVLPLPRASCPLEYCEEFGISLIVLGEEDLAAPLLRRVVESKQSSATAMRAYGVALWHRDELDEALKYMSAGLAYAGASAADYQNLGSLLVEVGRSRTGAHAMAAYGDAEEAFDRVVAGDAGEPDADLYFWRALARSGQGDNPGAISDLKEAVRLAPKSSAAWEALGELYAVANQEQEYREVLARLEELDPEVAAGLRDKVRRLRDG